MKIDQKLEEIASKDPDIMSPERLRELVWEVWILSNRIEIIDGKQYISRENFLRGPFEAKVDRVRRRMIKATK